MKPPISKLSGAISNSPTSLRASFRFELKGRATVGDVEYLRAGRPSDSYNRYAIEVIEIGKLAAETAERDPEGWVAVGAALDRGVARCEVCKNASVRERKATRTTRPSRCRCEDSRGKLACTPKSGVKPVDELILCERSAPVKLPLLTRGNQVRARKRATKVLWFAIRHLMAHDRIACWFRQLPPRG